MVTLLLLVSICMYYFFHPFTFSLCLFLKVDVSLVSNIELGLKFLKHLFSCDIWAL